MKNRLKNTLFFFLFFLSCSNFLEAQEPSNSFQQHLIISSKNFEIKLTIGQNKNATDRYDKNVDLPAPPAPLKPSFDTRIVNPSEKLIQYYFKDLRSLKDRDIFNIRVRPVDLGSPIYVSWSNIPNFSDTLNLNLLGRSYDLTQKNNIKINSLTLDGIEGEIKFSRLSTLVSVESSEIPTEFNLGFNYPNPFNPDTKIEYAIPRTNSNNTFVTIKIYNIRGQLVRTLVDGNKTPGFYKVIWNGDSEGGNQIASGVYIYIMTAGDFKESKKLLLLK